MVSFRPRNIHNLKATSISNIFIVEYLLRNANGPSDFTKEHQVNTR